MQNSTEQPSYHILICLIEIWNPVDKSTGKPLSPQDLMMPSGKADFMIAEVESLEIRESYRNVVGSANIKFPRGTVIKKTIEATNPSQYSSAVIADITSQGALIETRTNSDVAQTSDFAVGSRVRISLGYTTDPEISELTRVSTGRPTIFTSDEKYNEYKRHLTVMFEGYITKCSIDTPIEIECEDLAHLLKCVTCKKIITTNKSTVKDLLDKKVDGGVHGLLEKTGLKLHPDTEDIVIGKFPITTDFTPFDVLDSWHKWKIFAYLDYDKNGNPCIAVRNTYFSGGAGSLVDPQRTVRTAIDFGYHVADNNLSLMKIDNKSLAIQASSKDADEKKITTLTLLINPEWKEGDSEKTKWRIENETKVSKHAMKKFHIKKMSDDACRRRLSEYHVVEYQSRRIGATHDQLLEEAIAFYNAYNMNGVDGSLTIFGDLKIHTADIVELQDIRFPMKNGKYLVEEVVTKFGTSGFRQTIKLPYCLQRGGQKKEKDGNQK